MSNSSSLGSVFTGLLKKWFGPFTKEEFKKYLLLGVIFAFIIGVYWTLRPLKDAIFGSVVGRGQWLAYAKIVSMCMLFPLVALYGKLVDRFPRDKMFYLLGIMYAALMVFWGIIFALPGIGLTNTVTSEWRIVGWLWYVFVESFGSLMVALFWAFISDISDPKSAKYGFPLVVLVGQLGGILGPRYLSRIPNLIGAQTTAPLVALLSVFILIIVALVAVFMKITPKDQLEGFKGEQNKTIEKEDKEEPGFLDGLKLLVQHKYLLGIFIVLSAFEVIATFIDFNFKNMVFEAFSTDIARNLYLSNWGSTVNFVAFICLLLGVNNIQRWLGVRFTLALMPFVVGLAVVMFKFYHNIDVLFWLIVGAKAINYALNSPTLKQLYVPTTPDAKYKSQAWIETFGSRGAKGSASGINALTGTLGMNVYLALVFYLSLGLLGVWFFVALFLGREYNQAIKENRPVC